MYTVADIVQLKSDLYRFSDIKLTNLGLLSGIFDFINIFSE